jgi:hypothetical protein
MVNRRLETEWFYLDQIPKIISYKNQVINIYN